MSQIDLQTKFEKDTENFTKIVQLRQVNGIWKCEMDSINDHSTIITVGDVRRIIRTIKFSHKSYVKRVRLRRRMELNNEQARNDTGNELSTNAATADAGGDTGHNSEGRSGGSVGADVESGSGTEQQLQSAGSTGG